MVKDDFIYYDDFEKNLIARNVQSNKGNKITLYQMYNPGEIPKSKKQHEKRIEERYGRTPMDARYV